MADDKQKFEIVDAPEGDKFTIEDAPSSAKTATTTPTMGQTVLMGARDVGVGALKGAGHTLGGLSPLINKIPYIGETLAPSSGIKAWEETTRPTNTMQKVGFTGEQVGEFLLPAGIEEKGGLLAAKTLPKLGKAAAPLGRIATGALTTGTVGGLQGGDVRENALMGAGFGALGEGAKLIAPSLAESALGITKRMRGFGKTPGEAALGEIKGVSPGSIAENARTQLTELTSQLEQAASRSTTPTSTQSAVGVVTGEMQKAQRQNNKTLYNALRDVHEQLTTDFSTGQALPAQMPASQLLDLKRGIGDLEGNWNPELRGKLKGIVRQVYSALDKELDRAVPEADKLNQRISSLIPVAERGESVGREAGTAQRIAHRMAAHTGALAGAGIGAGLGYQRGGNTGALMGAGAGLILPELMTSPTVQMAGARALRSDYPARMVRGVTSQLLREKPDDESDDKKGFKK